MGYELSYIWITHMRTEPSAKNSNQRSVASNERNANKNVSVYCTTFKGTLLK